MRTWEEDGVQKYENFADVICVWPLSLFPPSPGMYLLLILVCKTFISERRIIMAFSALGWGVPAALVLSYALLRALSAEKEHQI